MPFKMFVLSIVATAALASGCQHVSEAERALWEFRQARDTIERVTADRESAKDFVPVQQRICNALISFDEVAECECVIHPETLPTETLNSDASITYGESTTLKCYVLITLKSAKVWDNQRARREVADLLRDNGLKDFTLDPPVHSGLTWIVRGEAPPKTPPGRFP